jgi:flotillin
MELAMLYWPAIILGAIIFLVFFASLLFRVVVPTNQVHTIQKRSTTLSYGKDYPAGNVYFKWPSWIPFLGISASSLSVSIFSVDLEEYEAYDIGRLPFLIDVVAFFRVSDANIASQRCGSQEELHAHLLAVVQGAARTILASNDIEEIMQGRSKFGEDFTTEVKEQLKGWGVETVKSIELMDIKDSPKSSVIANIMAKKQSHIDMESRKEVAQNRKEAELSEIEAQRIISLQKQDKDRSIQLRSIEVSREIQLAEEQREQVTQDQAKITKEKLMEVQRTEETLRAEINKSVALTHASQSAEVRKKEAEADKETSVIIAEGKLQSAIKDSEAITAKGKAEAEAKSAMEIAEVQSQITLSKEIGTNKGYQDYLIKVEQIQAMRDVGMEQAKALTEADIKIMANSGDVPSGMNSIMDIFSSKGGMAVASMLETASQSPVVKKLLGQEENNEGKN